MCLGFKYCDYSVYLFFVCYNYIFAFGIVYICAYFFYIWHIHFHIDTITYQTYIK